ncbi:MAG TPA: hypothetical protein VK504_01355 [Vicinamibacterales bacterium]|nr:hypothetical protein [Vicinamibacterales bacterium]
MKALPAPIVALLFLAAVTLSAVLLVHLPLAVKDLRRFPFAIRVTETFSGNRDIQLHAVVLNRRSDRRVVLHVALRLDSAAGQYWLSQPTLREDLNLSLGPDEHSDGVLEFKAHGPGESLPDAESSWLKVIDLVSGREATFLIPGGFPKDNRLVSNKVATFVHYKKSAALEHSRSQISDELLKLRTRVVHEILNTAEPPQHLRDAVGIEWMPRARAWDSDVKRVMTEIGCKPEEIQYVWDFPLPAKPRTANYHYDMNVQWTICDIRRERLEKIIDDYLELTCPQ